MAVAEASFNTVMLSMSCGLSHEIWLPMSSFMSDVSAALMSIDNGSSWITPSTTHSGLVLPRMVDVPRMVIFGDEPTRADLFTTDIPAILPCNIWSMLWYAGIIMSSAFTVVNAPTMSLRGRRA